MKWVRWLSVAGLISGCGDSHSLLVRYDWAAPYDPSLLTIVVDGRGVAGSSLIADNTATGLYRHGQLSIPLPDDGPKSLDVFLVSGSDTLAHVHGQMAVRGGYDGGLSISARPLTFRPLQCHGSYWLVGIRPATRPADSLYVSWGQYTPEVAGSVC